MEIIRNYFRFDQLGTNFKTEIIAGSTTFMTMAYIIVVNPAILSNAHGAKMSFEAVMTATCLASAFATLLMAFIAKYPIALAPGMGLNAFFSFEICNMVARLQGQHQVAQGVEPWQLALGMVFISGVLFTILSLLKVREMIINAIPSSLKFAISCGIGLFIAFIGLMEAGIVVGNPQTFVQFGKLSHPPTLLALMGLLITIILLALKVRGAILLGLIATGLLGIPFGIVSFDGVLSTPPPMTTFGQLHVFDVFSVYFIAPILMLLFFDMFDTIGTLVGVSNQAGFLKDGKLPRATGALASDSVGTMVGSIMGTSTVTSYIESASGVAEGGRSGFASVVTALLFVLALFFSPLIKMFAASAPSAINPEIFLRPITAPALILVGYMMMKSVKLIQWDDITEGVPAFLTILMMPLTFSISHGFSVGFISYPIVKTAAGKAKEVHWLIWTLAGILLTRYIFLPMSLG
jgi:adenine/guanine/hypoxanthine permease